MTQKTVYQRYGKDNHSPDEHQEGCLVCGSMDVFYHCSECRNLVCRDLMTGVNVYDEVFNTDFYCNLYFDRMKGMAKCQECDTWFKCISLHIQYGGRRDYLERRR